MTVLNPLPPSKRETNRYLVFEVISEGGFSKTDISKTVWRSALQFLGELGASKLSLRLIEWDEKNQKGILKVNSKGVQEARASLTLIKEIEKNKTIFHVLTVSGILKKARKNFGF
jgi:RNase P/RNase MRP subunit POP5